MYLLNLLISMLALPTLLLRQQADDPPKDDPPKDDPPKDDPPKDPPQKTFTQEELNRIAAREKQEGQRAAQQQVADDLGVSLDEAKRIIQEHHSREEADKTEAQRAREQADREKAEAEREKQTTAAERHDARVERALLRAGVPDSDEDEGKLDRVKRMVTVDVGAEYEDIKADVETIKKDFPQLFESTPSPGNGRAPSGDPPGQPPRQKTGGEDPMKKGAARAKARFNRGGDD